MANNRLRFYIERRYIYIILWILTAVSIFLVIKTSNSPIIPILRSTFIEKLFQQFYYDNSLLYDIAIGYLVSVIFYVIVVYLPEKQKQNDLRHLIDSRCETIIGTSHEIINSIIIRSGLPYNYRELTNEQLHEMCKLVNPKESAGIWKVGINAYKQLHFGFSIFDKWSRIVKEVDEVFRFMPYVETGLVKKLYVINEHYIKYMVRDLSVFDAFSNTDLEAWADTFYDYYMVSKDFRDYYVQYSKSKFENDPWKIITE